MALLSLLGQSAEGQFQAMVCAVVDERRQDRPALQHRAVKPGRDDAARDAVRVGHRDVVGRSATAQGRLEPGPSRRNAGVDLQAIAAHLEAQDALDPGPLHPTCRAGVPGPAAASDPPWRGGDVGSHYVGLHAIAVDVAARAGMVDRVEDPEERGRLLAIPQRCIRHRRPQRSVRVLAAVLADAGRIGLDVAGVLRRAIERRGEEQRQGLLRPDQLPVNRRHRAPRALRVCSARQHRP